MSRRDERTAESEADLLTLLRDLDDSERLERPRNSNRTDPSALTAISPARGRRAHGSQRPKTMVVYWWPAASSSVRLPIR